MYIVQSSQAFKFIRTDGGHEVGKLLYAAGLIVTSNGLKHLDQLEANDLVQFQPACAGQMMFAEWGRMSFYGPPGAPPMPQPETERTAS